MHSTTFDIAATAHGHDLNTCAGAEAARHDTNVWDLAEQLDQALITTTPVAARDIAAAWLNAGPIATEHGIVHSPGMTPYFLSGALAAMSSDEATTPWRRVICALASLVLVELIEQTATADR